MSSLVHGIEGRTEAIIDGRRERMQHKLGILDGFEWIMKGDIDHVVPLRIEDVSRIHFRGGSYIGISRANPTANAEDMENALLSLLRLGVTQLITIGGDDTAFSAMKLEEKAAGRL